MTSERPRDLWPSLCSAVQAQIVDPEQDDPGWMDDLSQWERDELRREARKELRMMKIEAERRSDGGHPRHRDDIRVTEVPSKNGRFKQIMEADSDT